MSVDLVVNALLAGLLLGGFYAAIAAGATVSFGLLDIVNIAHPAFVIIGAYAAFLANRFLALDPILAGVLGAPLFFALGLVVYGVYHRAFDRHGGDTMRGLAFFFGLMFITEVVLIKAFGVDYQYIRAPYVTTTFNLGPIGFPMRLVVPFIGSLILLGCVQLYLTKTYVGRAVFGLSHDQITLRLMAINPVRIKALAFALSIATASIAGSLFAVVQPIEPFAGRELIGRVFAICVLGGMGNLPGTLIASVLLGVTENMTSIFLGASWAPAVSFSFLILAILFRPSGLFGR